MEKFVNNGKKENKITTFPIPKSLAPINENINISTFDSKTLFKEHQSQKSAAEIFAKAFQIQSQGKIKEASIYYQYLLDKGYKQPSLLSNFGLIKKLLGNRKEAIILFQECIDSYPLYQQAYSNLAGLLKADGKLIEAEELFRKSISINTNFDEGYYNLGVILFERGVQDEAELRLRQAININQNNANYYMQLGVICGENRKLKEAEKFLRYAINIDPYFSIAYYNLGGLLRSLNQFDDAIFFTQKSIELEPNNPKAYYNLAQIYHLQSKNNLTIKYYKKALELDQENNEYKAELINSLLKISDFENVEKYLKEIKYLGLNGNGINPMAVSHLEDNPENQLKRAINLYKKKYKRNARKIKYVKKNKIHIGYFSADFIEHPVAKMIVRILELHDKDSFEIFAYSFSPTEDNYTKRIKDSVTNFRDIYNLSNSEAVELVRKDKLDIAIDLMGYTGNNRMPLFSLRVAPIQINYLGYEASTGSSEIDYIIADKIVIPERYRKFYSEKIIYIPNSYMCFSNDIEVKKYHYKRIDFGLPDDRFVLASFHRPFKITPDLVSCWSRILLKSKKCILWIQSNNNTIIENNLRESFSKKGVAAERIFFANKMVTYEEHLSRLSCADLLLDTFNWNANSTAMESLWSGLPIVTLKGKCFLARVSASFLTTLGLDCLIANSKNQYEEIVVDLAENPLRFNNIRKKLITVKNVNPLFDSELKTKDLEKIYFHLIDKIKFN